MGLKNKFEIAVVNKPSVFKPPKFYCIRVRVMKLGSYLHKEERSSKRPSKLDLCVSHVLLFVMM